MLAQATYNTNTQPQHIVAEPDIAVGGGNVDVLWEDMQNAAAGGSGVTKLQRAAGTAAGGTLGAPATVDTVPEPGFFRAPELLPLIGAGGGRTELAYETGASKIVFQDLTAGGGPQTVTTEGGFDLRGRVDSDRCARARLRAVLRRRQRSSRVLGDRPGRRRPRPAGAP